MEIIEPFSLENISISWNIYHNFENPPDETKFEGIFDIEVFPAESKKCEENAAAIKEIKNPFPDLKFVNQDQNYSVIIPSHRLLTASLEEEKVVFTFMPHGIKPIEGFPTEKHISWGRCSISGDSDQKSQILKNLIQILFINQETPRSRCESCKGLKMLIGDSDSDLDSELFDHQLICHDCLQGAVIFFKEVKIQIDDFERENNINNPREMLFQLIDGGIELADRLNNEKLNSEFLYFQALLLSKDEDPQIIHESLELLEEIIMFCSSWNYNKLKAKSEKLKSTILDNNPEIQSSKEEVILEKQEELVKVEEVDTPVQKGIKFLQKAKIFEQQGQYQEAVYFIKRASRLLVDNEVWTDEDYQLGQQEIFRLRNIITNVEPKFVEEVEPGPVEEIVPKPVEEVVPEPVEEVVPEPVEEVEPEPVEEIVPELVEEVVPEPVEEVVPEPVEEVVPEPVEEVVPEPVEEVVPEPVEEVVPEPVEEVAPKPVEEIVPEPVKEVVPETVQVPPKPIEVVASDPDEKEPIIESIEEIMKKIKKTSIQNLTLKPVKTPKPIKIFDKSVQDEELLKTEEFSTDKSVEIKLENKIKNLIEQQSSEDKEVSIEPTISPEEPPVSSNENNSVEIMESEEIIEVKIENKPSEVIEKAVETPKKPSNGYNMFGIPNKVSNNTTSSIEIKETEQQTNLKLTPLTQKSSLPKRRIRRRTSLKRTKTKIEICPMCAKLKCVCGYMDKVKN